MPIRHCKGQGYQKIQQELGQGRFTCSLVKPKESVISWDSTRYFPIVGTDILERLHFIEVNGIFLWGSYGIGIFSQISTPVDSFFPWATLIRDSASDQGLQAHVIPWTSHRSLKQHHFTPHIIFSTGARKLGPGRGSDLH